MKQNEAPKLEYHIIDCEFHPSEPGYVVCLHVAEQDAPMHVIFPATAKELGLIMCEKCFDNKDGYPKEKDVTIWCAECARGMGWIGDYGKR